MKISSIYMLARMHVLQSVTQSDRAAIAFFWPVIFLIIFGCVGKSISHASAMPLQSILILGALLDALTFRVAVLLARNVYEEVGSKSLPNLFSSPFTLTDWILSIALYAAGMFVVLCIFLSFLSFMLFGFNVFVFGKSLLILLPNIYCTALVFGFLGSCFIVRSGVRTLVYAFMMISTVTPLSGFFYDIHVMPKIVQQVSFLLPSYYIALQCKQLLMNGIFDWSIMLWAIGLNSIYLVMSMRLFVYMFEKSRDNGLAQL